MTKKPDRDARSFDHGSFFRASSFRFRHFPLLSRFFLIPIWFASKVEKFLTTDGTDDENSEIRMMKMTQTRGPPMTHLRFGYGEAGANGRENSIKRKSFASICVIRGQNVFLLLLVLLLEGTSMWNALFSTPWQIGRGSAA